MTKTDGKELTAYFYDFMSYTFKSLIHFEFIFMHGIESTPV